MSRYRLIPLTQGQFAIVDEADFDWLNQWPWFAAWNPCTNSYYAARRVGYKGKQRTIQMHKVLLNTPRNKRGDHISGATLDNRRANLRIASRRGNAINRRTRSDNTSGCVGVHKDCGKWVARIVVKGRRISLGSFTEFEDAVAARRAGEIQYYGKYVRQPSMPPPVSPTICVRALSARNNSGFTGVNRCHAKRRGTKIFVASLRIDGKPTHLGYFYTAEEAADFRAKFIQDRGALPLILDR